MNDILLLKGQFQHRKRVGGFGIPALPKNQAVAATHISSLLSSLKSIYDFWQKNPFIGGALVSVQYTRIVAKSNRLRTILSTNNSNPSDAIVGARFTEGVSEKKHIITYFLSLKTIEDSIHLLAETLSIVKSQFQGAITHDETYKIREKSLDLHSDRIKPYHFIGVIVDAFYAESFTIPSLSPTHQPKNGGFITIYRTTRTLEDILISANIEPRSDMIFDKDTLFLSNRDYQKIYKKYPYLIAMMVTDINNLSPIKKSNSDQHTAHGMSIPPAGNEPIIGVIDTLYNPTVYFNDWVDYITTIDPNIPVDDQDRRHGTMVDSLIVDAEQLNPHLADGCGRFRVRHFGVATSRQYSSRSIIADIRKVVEENPDIKVWNLSLGSNAEIEENFISPEASVLDELQMTHDILFIVAGTNDSSNTMSMRIGSPADSINSLVINSVNTSNEPAPYSRKGPVLAFYNKPDLSYYGGDSEHPLQVCCDDYTEVVYGTSFAAPLVARKAAHLIYRIGLTRETAKALLIDAALSWKKPASNQTWFYGHGVIPIHIDDILHSCNDEIRFIIEGHASLYSTYTYTIPVPLYKSTQPYISRATLCYFTRGERRQGVDYAQSELDLHFGRIKDGKIVSINNNTQNTSGTFTYEDEARSLYRKWDNVKTTWEDLKNKPRAKKIYGKGFWGIGINKTNRGIMPDSTTIPFGLVVTLKAIDNVNRIEDFVQQCFLNNWLVRKLDVNAQLEVYNRADTEIDWE